MNALVAYFSATGATAKAARMLADAVGGELYEIKTIVLFATSGGSGLGKSAAGLRPSAPGAKIVDGRMLNGRLNEGELKAWVSGLLL